MTGNPLYDPYQILMKVYAEKAYLKQAIADTYIEEAYRSRTVKAAYGVLENDAVLSDFSRKKEICRHGFRRGIVQKTRKRRRGGVRQRFPSEIQRRRCEKSVARREERRNYLYVVPRICLRSAA